MVAIAVIDYEMGNLHSVTKALEQVGATVSVVQTPHHLDRYDGLVLPGVGAFDPAMQSLEDHGFAAPLHDAVTQGQPLLGICLGMQLLFEGGDEGNEVGLGIVPGRVQRIQPEAGITIPHMGWNHLDIHQTRSPLWQNVGPDSYVYFVHSYACVPKDWAWVAATVSHGSQTIVAAIAQGNLMATQFHPEKSGVVGQQLLRNFLECTVRRQAPVG